MRGKTVVFDNKVYTVLHDYGNGQIEIKRENSSSSYHDVKLVKKEEVRITNKVSN